jgi:hypothetical protein
VEHVAARAARFLRAPDGTIDDIRRGRFSHVMGINPAGTATGVITALDQSFVRTADGTITMFTAGPQGMTASAINPAGTVTGWFFDAAGFHGFVRAANGSITTFDDPGGSNIEPQDINPEGTITGTYFDASGVRGFLRRRWHDYQFRRGS